MPCVANMIIHIKTKWFFSIELNVMSPQCASIVNKQAFYMQIVCAFFNDQKRSGEDLYWNTVYYTHANACLGCVHSIHSANCYPLTKQIESQMTATTHKCAIAMRAPIPTPRNDNDKISGCSINQLVGMKWNLWEESELKSISIYPQKLSKKSKRRLTEKNEPHQTRNNTKIAFAAAIRFMCVFHCVYVCMFEALFSASTSLRLVNKQKHTFKRPTVAPCWNIQYRSYILLFIYSLMIC